MTAESQVALLVDIYLEGVPGGDHDPHTDVKLAIKDEHGVLDILLDHPGLLPVGVSISILWLCMVVQIVLLCWTLRVRRRG